MNSNKTQVKRKEIEDVKEEGNRAFKGENYYKAILFYEEGLRRCTAFSQQNEGQFPFKLEIGENPKLKDTEMFHQDFNRMKAILHNNISMSYFRLNKIPKADNSNSQALAADPDYAKALYWKLLIMEKLGHYTNGADMAKFCIRRFDDDIEEESNKELVPKFKEIRDRLISQIPFEKERKKRDLEKDVEKDLDEMGFNHELMDELTDTMFKTGEVDGDDDEEVEASTTITDSKSQTFVTEK